MSDQPDKTKLICLWIEENFPLARVVNQGSTPDTEVWLLVQEGAFMTEIDLNRRSYTHPIEMVDWFFSHANARRSGDVADRTLIKTKISDPEYFNKLRTVLEHGGLTYRERQT